MEERKVAGGDKDEKAKERLVMHHPMRSSRISNAHDKPEKKVYFYEKKDGQGERRVDGLGFCRKDKGEK
jgi:hypothetical protein